MAYSSPGHQHHSQKTATEQQPKGHFFKGSNGAGMQAQKGKPFFQAVPLQDQQAGGGDQEMIQRKVVWKQPVDIPPDYLLIFDVDDGDFVGGCVKQIVPHGGIKLIHKFVGQIFNMHFGIFVNPAGDYCLFFYESVSGTCLTECYADLEEALEKAGEWIKEKIQQFLDALEGVAKFIILAVEVALRVAIWVMMALLLALAAAAALAEA